MTGTVRQVLLAVCLVGAAAAASAQGYPVKPVRLIVPLAAGGPSDIMARNLAQKLGASLGQQVVVDNRPGAGGAVGTDLGAKAAPDGYTLVLVSNSFTVDPTLNAKLPYDTFKDLVPISLLASAPYVLVARPSLQAGSLQELVALAGKSPGRLNYASGGSGTGPHVSTELLKLRAAIHMTHIPYKGAGPAMTDLVGGQVDVLLVSQLASLPHIKAGRMKPLAVSSARRSTVLPDVPTVAESGFPGYDEYGYFGVVAPAGTPHEIVTKLHAEIVKAMNAPELRDRLARDGVEVVASTPAEFAAFIRADVDKWADVIRKQGIKAD
jgi:tripartite-type tricarboxylate transporter receptor subunit TctC